MRYDDAAKRIVVEPIELAQEFRKFEYSTPWEMFPAHREGSEEIPVKQVDSGEEKK